MTKGEGMAESTITRRRFLLASAYTGSIALTACASTNRATGRLPSTPSTAALVPAGSSEALPQPLPTTTPIGVATSAPATTSAPVAAGGPATFVDHGPDTDMVALTFHLSGQPSTVSAMLDLLRARSVAVTAFAVGKWITANPEITKRAVADGHELGNHTEHHLSMGRLTRQQISDEIVQCGQALMPFIGSIGRWFRPSATVVPDQVILDEAGRAGYPVSVGYDVDSVDNKDPGAAAIVANVKAALHPGAIVSLHFGHQGTIDALPHILDELARLNLRPVTLGALLG